MKPSFENDNFARNYQLLLLTAITFMLTCICYQVCFIPWQKEWRKIQKREAFQRATEQFKLEQAKKDKEQQLVENVIPENDKVMVQQSDSKTTIRIEGAEYVASESERKKKLFSKFGADNTTEPGLAGKGQ